MGEVENEFCILTLSIVAANHSGESGLQKKIAKKIEVIQELMEVIHPKEEIDYLDHRWMGLFRDGEVVFVALDVRSHKIGGVVQDKSCPTPWLEDAVAFSQESLDVLRVRNVIAKMLAKYQRCGSAPERKSLADVDANIRAWGYIYVYPTRIYRIAAGYIHP